MHLGTLIGRLRREEDAALALEALDDIVLYADVAAMGERFDETPAAYVATAAARFANLASNDDWTQVIGAAGKADEPGRAILARMLRWALERDRAGGSST